MSRKNSTVALKFEQQAEIFAALGDPTRLTLVAKLNDGSAHSIATLTSGTKMTRQAVTRHLSVLEEVGLVSKVKAGRESLYELDAKPLKTMQEYLNIIASQWDESLNNLKFLIEE